MYVMPAPPAHLGSLGLMMPRPNQAVIRGVYYAPHHSTTRTLYQMNGLSAMGQSSVNMPLLIGGLAVGGLALWMMFRGKKRAPTNRRIASLAASRERATQQLKALGA